MKFKLQIKAPSNFVPYGIYTNQINFQDCMPSWRQCSLTSKFNAYPNFIEIMCIFFMPRQLSKMKQQNMIVNEV